MFQMLVKVYTQIKRSTCVSLYYYGLFPSLLFWRGMQRESSHFIEEFGWALRARSTVSSDILGLAES